MNVRRKPVPTSYASPLHPCQPEATKQIKASETTISTSQANENKGERDHPNKLLKTKGKILKDVKNEGSSQ
jgi:hypothetical protein